MIQHTEYSIFSNTLVKHNLLKRFLWCCNVVTENFDFVEKEYNEFFKLQQICSQRTGNKFE